MNHLIPSRSISNQPLFASFGITVIISFVSKFECNLPISFTWLAFLIDRTVSQESLSSQITIDSTKSPTFKTDISSIDECISEPAIIPVN